MTVKRFSCLTLVLLIATAAGAQPTTTATDRVFFSTPQLLFGNGYTPDFTVGANGDIYAAAGPMFTRSTNGGKSFESPKNLLKDVYKGNGYVGAPLLAVDIGGNINVMWNIYLYPGYDVFFSRSSDKGVTFSLPKQISSGGPYVSQIATDPKGNIDVLWQQYPTETLFSRSTDEGNTFSIPKTVAEQWFSQMVVDVSGNINIIWPAWDGWDAWDIFFTRSTDGGDTFSSSTNISNGSYDSNIYDFTVDNNGNINVVWWNLGLGILFSRSVDGIIFSAPKLLVNGGTPRITVDMVGNIYVVGIEPNPFFNDIFFTSSVDGGNTFSVPQNISNTAGDSMNPWIAVGASGTVNVAWSDSLTNPYGSYKILFSQSKNEGATFSAPEVVSQPGGSFYEPKIVLSKNGNINMLWLTTNRSFGYFSYGPVKTTQCRIDATRVYINNQLQYKFTARVTPILPATGTPTGNVTFWDSAYSMVVLGQPPLVNGKTSVTVLLDPEPNPQFVKAVYKGDGNFQGCETPYLAVFQ